MKTVSRREFLRGIAALTALAAVGPSPVFGQLDERPFEMLVVGDSLIWGQGLEEKDKFYTLTADWLRREHFRGRRDVSLTVKAHSGATLKFHPDEAEKYRKADRDEAYQYPSELNVGFPSSWKQIEMAAEEYRSAGKPGADLVMISGGITDITTSRVYDPKGDDEVLRAEIKKYCAEHMYEVLELALAKNPNAQVAVIGYFGAITQYTSSSKVLNAWLELLSFPRAFKFIANNPLVRPIFFNKLRKGAIRRSKIWHEESDRQLAVAVDRINAKFGKERAVFVPSPLTERNAAEAPETMLFRMGKGGIVKDPKARDRIRDCRKLLPQLKNETGIEYSVRLCEASAIGHPDQNGARMYANAINSRLSAWLRRPT